MLTRRHFGRSVLAAAGCLAPTPGQTQTRQTIRAANASGVIDAQLIFSTVGEHPRLGYYDEENCGHELINMSGSGQTMQAITAGNCDVSPLGPPLFLPIYAKNKSIDIIYAYCWMHQPHWMVGVKPDSPNTRLEQLKGKMIGIRNQGDTGYFGARAMLKELGLDPDKDVEWTSIGEGGPAGEAVYKGRVDAMAYWDGGFARVEIAGFPLRFLPNTPGMRELFGQGYVVRKSELPKNRDILVRYFRAIARSTLFAYTNPELSIRLHWEIYPETKPKGRTDAEAMKEALLVVNSRKEKWMPAPWQADKRFGAQTREEWEAQVKFAGLEAEIKDVSGLFTTELLDDINKFDRAKVIEQARGMKI